MAAVTVKPYGKFALSMANKEIDLNSDTLKLTLHTSSYAPNLDTHDYVDDLTNELSTGSGYTSGGVTLSVAMAYVAANSWSAAAATSTAYSVGQVVRPSSGNGYLYRCSVAGTSGGSAPTWPTTVGATVTDGGVTWTNVGRGAFVLTTSADPSWATFSAGPFRYGVISDRTPGTAATQPLIALLDWGSDQTGGGSTYTVTFDATGLLHAFILAA